MTELGGALRRWRERLHPDEVGVVTAGRRRTSGLRREELAALAGVSVDYVVRLEQGRATHPSGQVLGALAHALRLSDDERRLLFTLAGLAPPGRDEVPTRIPPSMRRLLQRFAAVPVAVFDAAWTLLDANAPYVALMGECHGKDRNAVWRTFLGSGSRARYTDDERRALEAELVADLHDAVRRYPGDARLRALVAELREGSELFARLWDADPARPHVSARKRIDHPDVGLLHLDCDLLTVVHDDLRVMVYTAEPWSDDERRLAQVIG